MNEIIDLQPEDVKDVTPKKPLKRQKVAVIGRGTAGVLSAMMLRKWGNEYVDVEVFYNPDIPEVSVGEGSQLSLPALLYLCQNWTFKDYVPLFNSTLKCGIQYYGWGTKGDFFHSFPPPGYGMHFSATQLQDVLMDTLKQQDVKFTEADIGHHNDIDADFIMDARGGPSDPENNPLYEPLKHTVTNAAVVAQCEWDAPLYNYTIADAQPNGWIFGIPLQNRISFGYCYNSEISKEEDIQKELEKYVSLSHHDLRIKDDPRHLHFDSYRRKVNWVDNRVAYVGNTSFFAEPLEATAIEFQTNIIERTIDLWSRPAGDDKTEFQKECNSWYTQWAKEAEAVIMCHYAAENPRYPTEFWKEGERKGQKCLLNCERWNSYADTGRKYVHGTVDPAQLYQMSFGGGWNPFSFKQNIEGLGLYSDYE